MNIYFVSMPITGHITLEVEAENEKGAIEAWSEKIEEFDDPLSDDTIDSAWEYVEHVTEGNVTHAELNDVEVCIIREKK